MIIIYVCHDQESVDTCIKKDPNAYIFLVGPSEINTNNSDKIIIARDLPDNIEHERKLLTFTAWYAIIKNNLFLNEEHLCILEWDTTIPDITVFSESKSDIMGFFVVSGHAFLYHINYTVLSNYLKTKNIVYENRIPYEWTHTTNYIIRRSLLEKFVDFYYPSCIEYIKAYDLKRFSWYHERIFWTFLVENKASINYIKGASHFSGNTHSIFND